MTINRDFFEDLFVLEMANNHWGRLERGKKIVDDFAHVVRYNGVRASIKLQLRDVEQRLVIEDHVALAETAFDGHEQSAHVVGEMRTHHALRPASGA